MKFIKYDLSNAKRFSVAIDKELLEKFKILAKKEHRSANRQLFVLVKKFVVEYEKKNGEITTPNS